MPPGWPGRELGWVSAKEEIIDGRTDGRTDGVWKIYESKRLPVHVRFSVVGICSTWEKKKPRLRACERKEYTHFWFSHLILSVTSMAFKLALFLA